VLNNKGIYYSDSWDYVVVPSQSGPTNALHPPSIYWIWSILCFGQPSEIKIVIWQMLFGVVNTCLIYVITLNFLNRILALSSALIFTASPFQLFFEKVLMPEAISTTVLLICIGMTLRIFRTQKYKNLNISVTLLGTGAGCLVILKPSNLVVSVAIIVYCAFRIYQLKKDAFGWTLVPTFILLILVFCGPIYVLASHYNQYYGSLTLSPVTGTVLSARWSSSLSCQESYTRNENSLRIIDSICKNPNRDRVSSSTFQIYTNSELTKSMAPSNDFSSIQAGLMKNLIGNALRDPTSFLVNELTVISEFLLLPVINDLDLYVDSKTWGNNQIVKDNFVNVGDWLDKPHFPEWSDGSVEKQIITPVLDFPRFTFLLVLCLVFFRMSMITILKLTKRAPKTKSPISCYFLYVIVVLYFLTLTLAAPPLFRYWYIIGTLMPTILLIEFKKLYDLLDKADVKG
jgi:hypothetical protein